jgi:hypothetical protein
VFSFERDCKDLIGRLELLLLSHLPPTDTLKTYLFHINAFIYSCLLNYLNSSFIDTFEEVSEQDESDEFP